MHIPLSIRLRMPSKRRLMLRYAYSVRFLLFSIYCIIGASTKQNQLADAQKMKARLNPKVLVIYRFSHAPVHKFFGGNDARVYKMYTATNSYLFKTMPVGLLF